MSRVGKQPIAVPSGVTITVDSSVATITGPKGALKLQILPGITLTQSENELVVSRENDEAANRARHGLIRSLLHNNVVGVTKGFERKLELNGVGYRVSTNGSELKFNIGFSHEVIYKVPADIKVSVEGNIITVQGIDKQQVGQVAAEIRSLKKPEPYKGKGLKYVEERIIRKSGKSGKDK